MKIIQSRNKREGKFVPGRIVLPNERGSIVYTLKKRFSKKKFDLFMMLSNIDPKNQISISDNIKE